VLSIVGRFLEHSRVWQFGNGGDDEFYIGSADWMPRNFLRRVEAVAPVETPRLRERLRSLLQTCLDDNRQAWELDLDGHYTQRTSDDDVRGVHARLIADSWGESETPLAIERTGEHPAPRAQQTGD
jgi:polyphosphate kinase